MIVDLLRTHLPVCWAAANTGRTGSSGFAEHRVRGPDRLRRPHPPRRFILDSDSTEVNTRRIDP